MASMLKVRLQPGAARAAPVAPAGMVRAQNVISRSRICLDKQLVAPLAPAGVPLGLSQPLFRTQKRQDVRASAAAGAVPGGEAAQPAPSSGTSTFTQAVFNVVGSLPGPHGVWYIDIFAFSVEHTVREGTCKLCLGRPACSCTNPANT